MTPDDLVLFVASYQDAVSAAADCTELKLAEESRDLEVVGSVRARRQHDGRVQVTEIGGPDVAGRALLSEGAGLVVGLFAPPLLLSAAVQGDIPGPVRGLVRKHDQKKMGVELEEYLPPGSSAILVVLDDKYLDRVDKALTRATKKVNKAVATCDYHLIQQAIGQEKGDNAERIIDGEAPRVVWKDCGGCPGLWGIPPSQ